MSTAFSEMNADDCGIKDIGPVVWDDVVDLAVKKEDLPFKKENLPFVPSVKDNISYSSKSHKQKGRGHSIRDAIKKRKVKADREKLNQLEAEKLGHCPSAPPKKRKRETSHVSPENSKKTVPWPSASPKKRCYNQDCFVFFRLTSRLRPESERQFHTYTTRCYNV